MLSINKNYLEKTGYCLQKDNCNDFYTLLNQELKYFLSQKLLLSLENITIKNISIEMDKAGIDNYVSLQTQQLLQEIEWQLYTPFERSEKMYGFYARAQTLVQSLQTHS